MTSQAGVALYASTDQVRFVRIGAMRDVDPFVGVSSVGADPTILRQIGR